MTIVSLIKKKKKKSKCTFYTGECVYPLVSVSPPVRSFSLNWISGNTMLSAIWVARSECSEFSWTTNTRGNTKDTRNEICTTEKRIENFNLRRRRCGDICYQFLLQADNVCTGRRRRRKRGNNVRGAFC